MRNTGFELQTFCVGSNSSTIWASTFVLLCWCLRLCKWFHFFLTANLFPWTSTSNIIYFNQYCLARSLARENGIPLFRGDFKMCILSNQQSHFIESDGTNTWMSTIQPYQSLDYWHNFKSNVCPKISNKGEHWRANIKMSEKLLIMTVFIYKFDVSAKTQKIQRLCDRILVPEWYFSH